MLSFLHVALALITVLLPLTDARNSATIYSISSSISEAQHTAKPDCPMICGNITVPFPFGIGQGCYADTFFEIICNASFTPPKAFLAIEEMEVLGIYDTTIIVTNKVAYTCFDKLRNQVSSSTSALNFSGTPFWISTENKFNVLGCQASSLLSLNQEDSDTDSMYISACVALCSKTQDLINGSCAGIGCCQSSIPEGLPSFYIETFNSNESRFVSSFSPCSIAFLAEQNSYTFQISDLSHDASLDNFTRNPMPVVIEWAIGNKNCNQTRNRLCQQESVCVDLGVAQGGYRCNCSKGFYGNPYLSPGCQDINECEIDHPCVATATCTNLPGSYNCSCNGDHNFGDGRKLGVGCHKFSPRTRTLYRDVLIGLGSFFGVLVFSGLYKVTKKRQLRKHKEKLFKRNGGMLLQRQTSGGDHVTGKLTLFTSKVLEKATNEFDESRILGKGGQGTVYKGMLPDGRIVAIKKSKQLNENQREEFINEVVILSQINHRNIVKLLGCCLETEVPVLVYEFISNGTLFHLIHDDVSNVPFSWGIRLSIACEVANALAYLHNASSIPIYHRDMKTTNILLDEKYRAKLADFGISRSVSLDQTHLTTKVKGTFGYLDPEYFQTSIFTEKSDVYSFGVVLVELLSGKKPVSTCANDEERSLVSRFLLTMKSDCLETILDSQLIEEGVNDDHIAVAKLAFRCLNVHGRRRPCIRDVVMVLESIRVHDVDSSIYGAELSELSDDSSEETDNDDDDATKLSARSDANSLSTYESVY